MIMANSMDGLPSCSTYGIPGSVQMATGTLLVHIVGMRGAILE